MQHITKCDCKVNDFFDKFLCLCSNFFFTCISIFMIDFCVNCFLEWNVGFNCSDCLIVYKTMFNLWYNSSISAPITFGSQNFQNICYSTHKRLIFEIFSQHTIQKESIKFALRKRYQTDLCSFMAANNVWLLTSSCQNKQQNFFNQIDNWCKSNVET